MFIYWVLVSVFGLAVVYHFGTIALHVYRHKKKSLLDENFLDLFIEALVNGTL